MSLEWLVLCIKEQLFWFLAVSGAVGLLLGYLLTLYVLILQAKNNCER